MSDTIPRTEVEIAEQAIERITKKLETARGGDRLFYELVLKGWMRHLAFAKKEQAENERTK